MNDLSVCASVRPSVHCIMENLRIGSGCLGIIGRTGPGMRQVVRSGDRSTGRVLLGANLEDAITMRTLRRTCATVARRGPLPKLLWADLLCHVIAPSSLCDGRLHG